MRKVLTIAVIVLVAVAVFSFRLILVALGSALYIYLFPGLLARDRGHPKQREIQLFCALLGWLIVPWVIGIWIALSSPARVHAIE